MAPVAVGSDEEEKAVTEKKEGRRLRLGSWTEILARREREEETPLPSVSHRRLMCERHRQRLAKAFLAGCQRKWLMYATNHKKEILRRYP